MLGDLGINKALILPNEGGQSADGNYYKYWDSIGGLYTIGYGFTDSVFPNAVFQSMPNVMTPAQCDAVFEDVLGRFENWASYFTNIANGKIKLTAHQIAVMYDISWQWGNYVWSVRGYNPNYSTSAELFNAWSGDAGMNVYANRHQTRRNYWATPDPAGTTPPPPTPPKTTTKPKEKTKPKQTPQKKNNTATTAKPKKQNKIELVDGTYYLRNTQLWHLGKHANIMSRSQDFFSLNLKKKKTTNSGSNASSSRPSSSTSNKQNTGNNTADKKPSKPSDPKQPTQPSSNIEKFINKLASVPLRSISYANIRPQQDPLVCGWADCSGYIAWGLSEILPEVWNGGYTNTGTMNVYFRNRGNVIAEGTQWSSIANAKPKRGDILLMGDNSSTGAGLSSHVVAFIDGVNTQDVGMTPCPNIQNAQAAWASRPYLVLVRWSA